MLMFSRSSAARDQRGASTSSVVNKSSRGTLANGNGPQGGGGEASFLSASSSQQHLYRKKNSADSAETPCRPDPLQGQQQQRGSVTRRSLLRRGGSRPHSWHSTLQRGFQRARSRSSGRDSKAERDRAKHHHRSSASMLSGPYGKERRTAGRGRGRTAEIAGQD